MELPEKIPEAPVPPHLAVTLENVIPDPTIVSTIRYQSLVSIITTCACILKESKRKLRQKIILFFITEFFFDFMIREIT
jgi:hypothetical protein